MRRVAYFPVSGQDTIELIEEMFFMMFLLLVVSCTVANYTILETDRPGWFPVSDTFIKMFPVTLMV